MRLIIFSTAHSLICILPLFVIGGLFSKIGKFIGGVAKTAVGVVSSKVIGVNILDIFGKKSQPSAQPQPAPLPLRAAVPAPSKNVIDQFFDWMNKLFGG